MDGSSHGNTRSMSRNSWTGWTVTETEDMFIHVRNENVILFFHLSHFVKLMQTFVWRENASERGETLKIQNDWRWGWVVRGSQRNEASHRMIVCVLMRLWMGLTLSQHREQLLPLCYHVVISSLAKVSVLSGETDLHSPIKVLQCSPSIHFSRRSSS